MTSAARGWMVARLAVLCAVALAYLSVPARNYSWAEDSLGYMNTVRALMPQVHPNHLLFEHVYAACHWLLSSIVPGISVEMSFRIVTVVAALFAVDSVLMLARRLSGRLEAGIFAALLLAGSFGFWHYATVGDTYILPLALVLTTYRVMLRMGDGGPLTRPSATATLALAASAATLTHQMFCFFQALVFFTLCGAAWTGRGPKTSVWKAPVLFAVLSAVLIFGAYLGAYAIYGGGRGFPVWVLGHAEGGLWDPPSVLSPLKSLLGLGTAIVSPQFLFQFPSAADAVSQAFPNKLVVEEVFMAARYSNPAMVIALPALVFAAIVLLTALRQRAEVEPDSDPGARRVRRLLFAHFITYTVLTTLWEPLNIEFWISTMAVIAILSAVRLDWSRRTIRVTGAAVIVLLTAFNLVTAIRPLADRSADYWYAMNAPVFDKATEADVVISDCPYLCTRYYGFFSAAPLVLASRGDLQPAKDHLAQHAGGRLILSSDTFKPVDPSASDMVRLRGEGFRNALTEWIGGEPEFPVRGPGRQGFVIYGMTDGRPVRTGTLSAP